MASYTTTQDDIGAGRSIELQVEAEFRQSNYHVLRDVKCYLDGGVLTLQGSVPSFHVKQIAFAVARRSLPGISIDDRLRVTGS